MTLSTTGYGDITPATSDARLVNVVIITPARVLFLIILVGTTLEVLTDQYRNSLRVTRWRQKLKDHVIVCGYGTKGRAAVSALLETGYDKSRIVVVESRELAVRQAAANGLVAVDVDHQHGEQHEDQGGDHPHCERSQWSLSDQR